MSSGCFYCRKSKRDTGFSGPGHRYKCKEGRPNKHIGENDCDKCDGYDPQIGFQTGGYYTHMWFENGGEENNTCMDWVIYGNLEFPAGHDNGVEPTIIHICDFKQIEEWVKFWGKELRKRGWVDDDE